MKKVLLSVLAICSLIACFGQLNIEEADGYFEEKVKLENSKRKAIIHYLSYNGNASYGLGTRKIFFSFHKKDEVFLLDNSPKTQSLGVIESMYELSPTRILLLFKRSVNQQSGRFALLIYNTDQKVIEKLFKANIPIQKGKERTVDFNDYFFFEEGEMLYVMEEVQGQKAQKNLQLAISVYNFREDSKKKIVDTYYGIDAISGRPIINAFEYDPETDQLVFKE